MTAYADGILLMGSRYRPGDNPQNGPGAQSPAFADTLLVLAPLIFLKTTIFRPAPMNGLGGGGAFFSNPLE